MKTVSFEIAAPGDAMARLVGEAKSGRVNDMARITFRSPESMARVLTPTRWTLVQTMTGAGSVGIRDLARRVRRDVKGVYNDANALVAAGIIDRTDAGKYIFPFDRVKVTFELRAAA